MSAPSITAPVNGDVFNYGESVAFTADAGSADVASFAWSSSIDGEIGTDMTIPAGSSLTLADGVIVKFKNNYLIVEDNNLNNYDGEGVWFTSWKDDTLGGDSNGDGALTSPADGDWENILYDME